MSPKITIDSDDLAAEAGSHIQLAMMAAMVAKNGLVLDEEMAEDFDLFRGVTAAVSARNLCIIALSAENLPAKDTERFEHMRKRAGKYISILREYLHITVIRSEAKPTAVVVRSDEDRKVPHYLTDEERLQMLEDFQGKKGKVSDRVRWLMERYNVAEATVYRTLSNLGVKMEKGS